MASILCVSPPTEPQIYAPKMFLDAAVVVEAIETGREVELVLEGKGYRVVVRAE